MRFSGAAFIACFASFSLMPNAFAALSNKSNNLRRERRTNHELDHFVVDANSDFTGKLEMCQGDCDTDGDCKGSLVCFQREEGNIPVPGCDGGEEDQTPSDYCIAIPVLIVEANPNSRPPLGRCQGDCDFDTDCELGLYCFLREEGNIPVPGCNGGLQDSTPSDYCIAIPVVEANPDFTPPFGRCQGHCTSDDDCKSGLYCFQRGRNVDVPGCDGGLEDSTPSDYCIPIPMVEANPRFERPLGMCQGDCNADQDCKSGLVCFQREKNVDVPGCNGGLQDSTPSDYCIESVMPSALPISVPSFDPSSPPSTAIPMVEANPIRAALAALYDSTNGSGWTSNNNWGNLAIPVCSLTRVICSAGGDIISLNLGKSNVAVVSHYVQSSITKICNLIMTFLLSYGR
jgi:hypothetical protein